MTWIPIGQIDQPSLQIAIQRLHISLWIGEGTIHSEITKLFCLPIKQIWLDTNFDFSHLQNSDGSSKSFIYTDSDDQTHKHHLHDNLTLIHATSAASTPKTANLNKSLIQLWDIKQKAKLQDISGVVLFAGELDYLKNDLNFLFETSPTLQILLLQKNDIAKFQPGRSCFYWKNSISSFAKQVQQLLEGRNDLYSLYVRGSDENRLKLSFDQPLLNDLEISWHIISARDLSQRLVTQAIYDRFLEGYPEWPVFLAHGVYARPTATIPLRQSKSQSAHAGFVDQVSFVLHNLWKEGDNPTQSLRQILLYTEPGSGSTTLLRLAAIKSAESGFPTILLRRNAGNFRSRSVERFITNLQELMRSTQEEQRSLISVPICIIMDKEGEQLYRTSALAKRLTALNTKIVLIRCLERSAEEITKINRRTLQDAFWLPATIFDEDVLKIRLAMESICDEFSLEPMPPESEWHAYAANFREGLEFFGVGQVHLDFLFFICMSVFVKQHTTTERAIGRYYYRKWREIGEDSIQELVLVLAVLGYYRLSLPLEIAIRKYMNALEKYMNAEDGKKRQIDALFAWDSHAANRGQQALFIRHPGISQLLCRYIQPEESIFPYRAIIPLIKSLGTKEEDRWLAAQMAYELGRHFGSRSNRGMISIEIESALQRAARHIFGAMPSETKTISRIIQHHEARYHIAIVRACLAAMRTPKRTRLKVPEIYALARQHYEKAVMRLGEALDIREWGERDANILNTMATNEFIIAGLIASGQKFRAHFYSGLDYLDKALADDPTNYIVLSQYVDRVLSGLERKSGWYDKQVLELLGKAESNLSTLLLLMAEKRFVVAEKDVVAEEEVDFQGLVVRLVAMLRKLKNAGVNYKLEKGLSRETRTLIEIRELCDRDAIESALRDPKRNQRLLELRQRLEDDKRATWRGIIYAYRMYVADQQGRLCFERRMQLIKRIADIDEVRFQQFRHDEAALLCQRELFEEGEQRFLALRHERQAGDMGWLWLNERVLVDEAGFPRRVLIKVVDQVAGWALLEGTNVRVKFQPYQWRELESGEFTESYIRFRVVGLQAIPTDQLRVIKADLKQMGLAK